MVFLPAPGLQWVTDFEHEVEDESKKHRGAGATVLEKPFLETVAFQQNSQAIHLTEGDGRAADALSKGCAESRQRDLTEAAFGLLHPRESLELGCNQLEDRCCWGVEVGDVRLDKSLVSVKQVSQPSQAQ